MENNLLVWITGLIAAINSAQLVWAAWKKLKPEVKKLEVQVEEEEINLDERNLKNAVLSQQILIDRINELKDELEEEKIARKEELAAEREARKIELAAEREARRKEAEYLRRRFKEADREARDYRIWAAKLVKQVVESGKVPVPFIPSSFEESDPSLVALTKENNAEIEKKWDERKSE